MYGDTKVYLDEIPTLHAALKQFCMGLELDVWGSGAENWVHELACRRSDGFIPHGYNRGGFDVYNTLEVEYGEPGEDFIDEHDEGEVVFHGFRIMYEGQESGVHTVCVYYCKWYESDCWGMERAKTLSKTEIRFKKPSVLISKLKSFTKKAV